MVQGSNRLKAQLFGDGHSDEAASGDVAGDQVDRGPVLPPGLVTRGPGTRRADRTRVRRIRPAPLGTKPGDEDLPFCKRP